MNPHDRDMDRELQDLLDNRSRGGTAPVPDAARHELAAYKLVYQALAEEPARYLPPDFATELARVARDGFGFAFWAFASLLVFAGIAVSAVTLALALPEDSIVRALFAGLARQSLDLAPLLNATSVAFAFAVIVGLDRWLGRDA